MRHRIAVALVVASLLFPPRSLGAPPPQVVSPIDDPDVRQLMASMSVEQRVGQLFIVTFTGTGVEASSSASQLVRDYRVGGVVLRSEHNNFEGEGDTLAELVRLTNTLQMMAAQTEPDVEEDSSLSAEGPYVPLFVGIELTEGGYHYSQLLPGVTPMPSSMAIGATWDPNYAAEMGRITGRELDALGINLLLGPSLDVLESPELATGNGLGVSSFGGDPFWVAQMGAAYVEGVHAGSGGRLAVVPGHFPGLGSADRPANVEVPTVPRSLLRLIQVDLAPFFAVTNPLSEPAAQADGVQTAHIRYQGFQGDNPRLATRPISLDPQALQVLSEQVQVVAWHDLGGLLVSGALGEPSIRSFYDPSGATFPNRRIAQDAFLAGNDVLYLDGFGSGTGEGETEVVVDTIEFFIQRYEEDPTFQTRVDVAVARILRQKLGQFGDFSLEAMQRDEAGLSGLGGSTDVAFEVAQASLSLLSPSPGELQEPPGSNDTIVVFTDAREVSLCAGCDPQPLVPASALADAIERLYGPAASGLVEPGNITSYSFTQLYNLLEQDAIGLPPVEEGEPTPEPNPIQFALDSADWVIFVMLSVDSDLPRTATVKRFLAERPDVANDANIVVMALDAPYYLDATEISKLSAYYALYSSNLDFVNVAARALFQEALPGGAPPVSVSGINYGLPEVTSPDDGQVIELYAGDEEPLEEEVAGTPPPLEVEPGDTLRMRTGIIVDRNGNPVPDGTPVDFDINFVSEGLRTTQRATTRGGIAQSSLVLDRVGQIEVTALSEPARLSFTLFVNVQESGAIVFAQPPQVTPTATAAPTLAPSDDENGPLGTPTPEAGPPIGPPSPPVDVTIGDLLLTLMGLLVIFSVSFIYGQRRQGLYDEGLFYALPGLVGGLLVYNYYALKLPGSVELERWPGVVLAAWIGALLGFGLAVGRARWLRYRASGSRRERGGD